MFVLSVNVPSITHTTDSLNFVLCRDSLFIVFMHKVWYFKCFRDGRVPSTIFENHFLILVAPKAL